MREGSSVLARSSRPLTALIVGAGIGGLTAAVVLRRRGVQVQVLERAPVNAPLGATLELGPNSTRLLADLELLNRVREVGCRPEAIELVRWQDNRVLCRTPLGASAEDHFGAPLMDLLRADLMRVLLAALPDEAVLWGRAVTRLHQDPGGVEVTLDDGGRIRADLLIGADGIRSTVREQLFGAEDPVYAGSVTFRGLVEGAQARALLPGPPVKRYWLGPGAQVVAYWSGRQRHLGVAVAVDRSESAQESWTGSATRDEALSHLEGWDPLPLALVRQLGSVLITPLYARVPLEHWSLGRATLVGDSAHAMVPYQGQGASQAIEDAVVLGACLADASAADIPAALRHYERVRMHRAHAVQSSAGAIANNFYHVPDGPEQRRRDAELAVLPTRQRFGLRQAIWEHDVRRDVAAL